MSRHRGPRRLRAKRHPIRPRHCRCSLCGPIHFECGIAYLDDPHPRARSTVRRSPQYVLVALRDQAAPSRPTSSVRPGTPSDGVTHVQQ